MRTWMKTLKSLVWLTQLGLSVAAPLIVFIGLPVWLHQRFMVGSWCIWVGIVLGFLGAVGSLRTCLHSLNLLSKEEEDDKPKPRGFNDHD